MTRSSVAAITRWSIKFFARLSSLAATLSTALIKGLPVRVMFFAVIHTALVQNGMSTHPPRI
jgi:hypothetical protein